MKGITTSELIKKLKKFDPDGNIEVFARYIDNEGGCNDIISYLSLEEDDADGRFVIVIHTEEKY